MAETVTKVRAHAILSASGSKKWINCPPSAMLEEAVPEEASTDYADSGTFCHEGVALRLRAYLDFGGSVPDYELATWRSSKYWDQETEYCVEGCVQWAKDEFAKALAVDPSAKMLIEAPADYSRWVPEGRGTADVTIVYGDTIKVPDWKFGEGLLVSAVDNSQGRLYALGRLLYYQDFWDLKQVVVTIVQPRRDYVSEETLTVEALLKWADEVVVPQAKLAWAGKGEFKPGDWCQFCKVKDTCAARINAALTIIDELVDGPAAEQPPLLTPTELSALIKSGRLEQAKGVINSLYKYAYGLTAKDQLPGFKMVAGRAARAYTDTLKVEAALACIGVDKALLYKPPQLLGIGEMEKAIGKKVFKATLEACDPPLVVRKEGAPKMTLEEDKRPAVNAEARAAARFSDNPEKEETDD